MKLRVYLARHAETIANRNNILQGHCDYPLTPEGEEHSRALGELLKDKVWWKVYSSDLQRALSSCHNILSKSAQSDSAQEVIKTDLLREVNFGVREGLPRGTSVLEALEIKAAQANIPVDQVLDTSETPQQVMERQKQLIRFLYDQLQSEPPAQDEVSVLCISHGGYIRRFLTNFCNSNVEKISNCSVSIVRISWSSADDFQCEADSNEVNLAWESTYIP